MKGLHATLVREVNTSMEEAILNAAEQIFARLGFEEARVDAIAAAAQVSRKTLFNRFNSKESLLLAVLNHVRSRTRADFEQSDTPRYMDVRDAMPPDMEKRLATIHALRWILAMSARYAGIYDPGHEEAERFAPERAIRTRRIAAVQKQGGIRSDLSAEEIAQQFDMVRNAIYRGWLLGPDESLETLRSKFSAAMKVYLRGIDVMPEDKGSHVSSVSKPKSKKGPS